MAQRNAGKLSPLQKELVWTLKRAGKSDRETAGQLAKGSPNSNPPVAPVEITAQAVGRLYRKQRHEREALYSLDLAKVSTPEGLDLVARRLLDIADREALRLSAQQDAGKLDAAQLGKLASATASIHRLLALRGREPEPGGEPNRGDPGEDGDAPSAPLPTAERLLAESETIPPGPVTASGDVPVPEAVPDGEAP